MSVAPLPSEALFRPAQAEALTFESTRDLAPLPGRPGQARALEALAFGLAVRSDGYNLFTMGAPGAGKFTALRDVVSRLAAGESVPSDVCYVHDFEHPNRPHLLLLPAGVGTAFAKDVADLVEALRVGIPGALESEEFGARKRAIEEEAKERSDGELVALRTKALLAGVALVGTPMGFALAPIKDGDIVKPTAFAELPEDERQKYEESIDALGVELRELIALQPRREQEVHKKVKALVREAILAAVGHFTADLQKKYAAHPDAAAHIAELERQVLENVDDFLKPEEGMAAALALEIGHPRGSRYRRYQVNVLVDNGPTHGAPVVHEEHPTYDNLLGRIEHQSQLGALVTDFSLVRPGALHRANGGYLLLDARKLLLAPYAYEALKRALRAGQIRTEPLGQMLGLMSTVTLEPEPVPLKAKVVLFGERRIFYLLEEHDPEFPSLFKVVVDFEDAMDRDLEAERAYGRLVAELVRDEGLSAFDRSAVGRIIEHASREAEDAEKLSTHVGKLLDLLREADHLATRAGAPQVAVEHVQAALDGRERRVGRIRERLLEETKRGTLLVETDGEHVGQVNGLSVISLGRTSFGRPTRITARVRLGAGELVDIEREVELGGPIHSKGVLILGSFLGARFAERQPLSLRASLVFEQSYGGVEGDSASSAELYALLSALSELPLRQAVAVTGSVNQHGEVQAIGGVNEKIEGFFELCAARGLTGEQGVLIPRANQKHLMLRRDVREAVRDGRFHVWAVDHVDEGIEILTGVPAGVRGDRGYPDDSVNGRVEAKLRSLARARLELAASFDKKPGGQA